MDAERKIAHDDGGPAFPAEKQTREHKGMVRTTNGVRDTIELRYQWAPGMSLRDYFAGQALAGLLACPRTSGEDTAFAKDAYEYADAMIAERSK